MSSLLALLAPGPGRAEGLDCGKYVRGAQQAIDKVRNDMKGMQYMPRDELVQVYTLLADARMFLDAARGSCDRPESDFDQARAIAKAEAARGSAEAADVLRFHLMSNFAGMKDASGGKGRADADPSSTDNAMRR
jgi:hypothetical protein